MLIQIRLASSTPQRSRRGANRPNIPKIPTSESLFQDLETQLGASPSEYLRLRVQYSHSAFVPSTAEDVALETRLESTATPTIRRKNTGSLWARGSEYGDTETEPETDALVGIIARHWEVEKARRAVGMLARSREVENEAERMKERQRERVGYSGGSVPTLKKSPGRRREVVSRENVKMGNAMGACVPERQTSLGKGASAKKGAQYGKVKAMGGRDGNGGDASAKRDTGRWSWAWW